ncbi:amidohydrolase family protein [Hugenholtzia roseola]|uniref:amidohydrolase family protein n=1 Tax=Hugenholtzia roseola TaxID=1002 RepID=UPI0003FB3FBF|nr:amidohydrolase family protein [Hugenholtzia roseola]
MIQKNSYSAFYQSLRLPFGFCLLFAFLTPLPWGSAQVPLPASPQQKAIVIQNVTLHDGKGNVLEKATLRFEEGRITQIETGEAATLLEGAERIDGSGKHLYPALILPNTPLGLSELDAIRQSVDMAEVGALNPNVKAQVAFNVESDVVATMRPNGVLYAQITPRGELLGGNSALMALEGWHWEEATRKAEVGQHLYFPSSILPSGWWGEQGDFKPNAENRAKQIAELSQLFEEAAAYAQKKEKNLITEKNLKLESLTGLFTGEKTLFLHADWAKDIVESVLWAEKYQVKRIVVVGGSDAHKIIDFLKQHRISLILTRIFRLPTRIDDDYDLPFRLPAILAAAQIPFCLSYEGDMEVMGGRNLPFAAGMAVAYGLDKEAALRAITFEAAQILGVADDIGSIEVGKKASLLLVTGDLLDMQHSKIEAAFLEGRRLDLRDRQLLLQQKYEKRLEKE